MIKLTFESGPLAGQRFKTDVSISLGRDASNSIAIPDPSVSLVHCEIRTDGQRYTITDLGSTNATLVNGCRVISEQLHDGDVIAIGESTVRVEMPHGGATARRSARTAGHEAQPDRELSEGIFGSVTYLLKRKIADGGMGAVYEAEQFGAEGFIKRVAIKTILPSYAKKTTFVSSFVGEARLVANLVHQNIVQIHHLGRHEGGYYIAMEFIDGVNLTTFMKRHRELKRVVPVDIAGLIVSGVCRGLEYAHGKTNERGDTLGLVHRDVSPSNIMVTREGEVKLTDFGVAKAAQYMEDDDDYLVGSVEYMSPEQAACLPVDARSDIFSLGLVYYELLTGLRIFRCRQSNIEATVTSVKDCRIPDPLNYRAELSELVVQILLRCLRKSAEERFQSARELGATLEHCLYARGLGPTAATLAEYLNQLGLK